MHIQIAKNLSEYSSLVVMVSPLYIILFVNFDHLFILFRYDILYDIVDLRSLLHGIKILGSRAMYTDDVVI